jgi:hypothetical protein
MGARSQPSPQRARLAYEAARILAEQGDQAFDHARRKAALRIGVINRRDWPTNEEIQAALLEQRRLFEPERLGSELRRLRTQAVAAMGVFAKFRPRLVGSALSGAGDLRQGVRLHLFADSPEEVVFVLCDQHIPWHEREEPLRFGGGVRRFLPAFSFVAGDIPFKLVVLPIQGMSNPPLDSVTDRPERGADLEAVRRLLGEPGT